MEFKVDIKGWAVLVLVAVICVLGAAVLGEAPAVDAWFSLPLRDATIKDATILLVAVAALLK